MKKIPLTVVSGFLGAGKTTLINQLLAANDGERIAVLVNDFGGINIDQQLLERAAGNVIPLTNGCVCCSIGNDLTDALIQVTSSAPLPDRVIIEASGVSDPWKIAEIGLVDPLLSLDCVLTLIDVGCFLEQLEDSHLVTTLERQVKAADVLVLNKCSLAGPERVQAVRQWLAAHSSGKVIHETNHSRVPVQLLAGLFDEQRFRKLGQQSTGPSDHLHHLSSWSFNTDRLFDHDKLSELLAAMPNGILRAKGLVCTNRHPHETMLLQLAGSSRELGRIDRKRQAQLSELVFIGEAIPDLEGDMTARLRAALV